MASLLLWAEAVLCNDITFFLALTGSVFVVSIAVALTNTIVPRARFSKGVKALSDEIFLSVSAQSQMEEMAEDNKNIKWSDIPEKKYPIYDVYGKKFNPEKINEYIDSFAIKRT